MGAEIIRLVSSKENVVRACSTCQHRYKYYDSFRCGAIEMYCTTARITECRDGELWELAKPPLPVAARIRKWWLGW